MAVKLNLLPQDYAVSDSVATVLKIARPLNVVLLGIFLVTAMGMAGFFIFSSIKIKDLNSANSTLKNQIQSQQMAQQQVVLLKDRLEKIKKAYSKPSANKNLAALDPILVNLPQTVTVSELSLDAEKTSLVLGFTKNSDLTNFLDVMNNDTRFTSVIMDSFTYTPKEGYLVGFSFTIKNKQ